jgi:hypothetical protein
MALRACLLAFLLALSGIDARALEAPASYRYRILHPIFGQIGEHRMTVYREHGAVVVDHTAELAVEVLGLTAHHRTTRFREVWQGDRLVAYDGLVEDNGEPFAVRARATGDRLVVEGTGGRTDAPAATAPSVPSLNFAIERAWFFDSRTGELLRASVTRAGREPLKVGERVVEATKYEIAGDLEQHVWFEDSGAWVQWRLWRQGAAITLARE